MTDISSPYQLQEVYSENFYYFHFSNQYSFAKVYFWIFENKVSIEDFEVSQKRKGHGKKLFLHILNCLNNMKVDNVLISSKNTKEAYSFWSIVTNKNFNNQKFDQLIFIKNVLLNLKS